MLRLEKESDRDVACQAYYFNYIESIYLRKHFRGKIVNKVRFADYMVIITKRQKELKDMVNRLDDTGRKYGNEIIINKSQVKTASRSYESLLRRLFCLDIKIT